MQLRVPRSTYDPLSPVRPRGLEPPRAKRSQGPQPCASTNSATGAWGAEYSRVRFRPRGPVSSEHMFARFGSESEQGANRMDLTKRQQEIFDFIKRYSERNGYPPTVRDIGKAVGLASSSTVHAHLANLEKLGLLRRDPTKPRAMELLDRAAAGVQAGVQTFLQPGLPLVGQVAAGQPIVAEEN